MPLAVRVLDHQKDFAGVGVRGRRYPTLTGEFAERV
jgi:hypothetical protein